jgi:Transglycosylase SLT domain
VLRSYAEAGLFAVITSLWVLAPAVASDQMNAVSELDRVAYAVDGAESSHGKNGSMWRLDPAGPQGPMQVSEKAAVDVGGGNRFDVDENRVIGRAYLALLFRRYRNWSDAVSAYNWGLGHLDNWIRAGRPREKMVRGVAMYLNRVMRNSGICNKDAQGQAACETIGSSASGGSPARRSPVVSRGLSKALTLAVQFGVEQTRLERSLARSQ